MGNVPLTCAAALSADSRAAIDIANNLKLKDGYVPVLRKLQEMRIFSLHLL